MDLRRLTYFVAVAEERHLGRAAERLRLSAPLTRQIKALEAEVGAQLFERTHRVMVLTYGSAIFGIEPNILARFSRENPDVEIALYHAQTLQQVSALR